MKHLSYKQKLLLNFTLLFALFTALLVVFQYNRERQYKRDLLDSRLRCYANVVAETIDRQQISKDTISLKNVELWPLHCACSTTLRHGGTRLYEGRQCVFMVCAHAISHSLSHTYSNIRPLWQSCFGTAQLYAVS